jgi:cobalt-zinc-cadmium efflux system outer membrane protein
MREFLAQISISIFIVWLPLETGCIHYTARPLNPPGIEDQYRTRSLKSPELAAFVRLQPDKASINWPPAVLDLDSLILVAYFYQPDLDVARARAAVAEAAVITAHQRVNPSISGDAGYSKNPESALTYAGTPTFTIETAGKRGYRTMQAEKLADGARLSFVEAGWQVRSRVRSAALAYLFAQRRLDGLRTESGVREDLVEIFEKRRAAGEGATPDLDIVRADLSATQVTMRLAEGEVAQSLSSLETACGLPPSSLTGITITLSALEAPPSEQELPIRKIQRAGLLHRADVRRTLTEYAAADALLRLEIANQYPNITLSPSYAFQEGFADYTLGIGLSALPILHRHQGPIAEAEAQRRQVETQFRALQSRAIGQMEEALRQYRGALAEWKEASDKFLHVQQDREAAARTALAAGEGDRLAVDVARLLTITAGRTRLDALQRAQTALGALEDSMQHPFDGKEDLQGPSLSSTRVEAKR